MWAPSPCKQRTDVTSATLRSVFLLSLGALGHPLLMRADDGDESIEELAKDAAKAEQTLEGALDDDSAKGSNAPTGPAHRRS